MNKENTTTEISNSRRSLLKKAAIVIPAMLTLTTRSAYSQAGSFYGLQYSNSSTPLDDVNFQCKGLPSSSWKMVYTDDGRGNGNPYLWRESGFSPNEMFSKYFKNNLINEAWTLLDTLARGNDLERGVVTALLNSSYFGESDLKDNYISAVDVVGIYNAYVNNESLYTSLEGETTFDNLQEMNLAEIFHS